MSSPSPIDALLSRRSTKLVGEPGPSAEHLDLILRAAMTAPDHGRCRSWRFVLLEGAAIMEFAAFVERACEQAGKPMDAVKITSMRGWLSKAPLLMGLASYINPEDKRFPEQELILSTGAAVTQMLNAAHMLGYGAYWSTGLGTYLPAIARALGFDEHHRFLGFMSIGTVLRSLPSPQRPEPAEFVRRVARLGA